METRKREFALSVTERRVLKNKKGSSHFGKANLNNSRSLICEKNEKDRKENLSNEQRLWRRFIGR